MTEVDGRIVGFGVGNAETGIIWGCSSSPSMKGRGTGGPARCTVQWLWTRGLQWLWLTTGAGTRAERFYGRAGWRNCGLQPSGELRFELDAG